MGAIFLALGVMFGLSVGAILGYTWTYQKRRWTAEMEAYRALHDYMVLNGYDVSEWSPSDYDYALSQACSHVEKMRVFAISLRKSSERFTSSMAEVNEVFRRFGEAVNAVFNPRAPE